METMRTGEPLVSHHHFDDRHVSLSEFYRDFYLSEARGRYAAAAKGAPSSLTGATKCNPEPISGQNQQHEV
jgi:hypothetical protein